MTSRDTTDHRASIIELMPHPNTLDQLRWLRTVCHKEYNIARAAEQINVCQNYEQKMEGTTGLLPPPPAANCDLRSVLEYMAEVHENAEYQRLRALVLEDDFLWRGLQSNGLLKVTIAQNLRGEMYQRNANKSQLLRLPGEIRNKIWQFATSGYYVYGPYYEDGWGACSYSTQKFERDISAFQLPQVCRQIYTETATLPYTTNTFILLYSWGKAWTDAMIPAYRKAITSIYVDLDYCPTSPAWFLTIAHLLKELPNLGHAQFSAAMVYMVQLVDEHAVDAPETMERCEWQAYMVKKLEEADVHGLTYAFAE